MTINELQKAQVAAVEALFPALGSCDVHGGRFDLGELAAMSAKTPAIFVAFLSIKGVEECGDGRSTVNGLFSAYIVTTDKKGLDRGEAGKNMAEAIARWLPNNRLGLLDVGAPEAIGAANLYNGKARQRAVSLWAVTWAQKVTGGASDFPAGVVPEHLYIGGELVNDE